MKNIGKSLVKKYCHHQGYGNYTVEEEKLIRAINAAIAKAKKGEDDSDAVMISRNGKSVMIGRKGEDEYKDWLMPPSSWTIVQEMWMEDGIIKVRSKI